MSNILTLAYWDGIRGRVHPIRLLLEYLNHEYHEENYTLENYQDWFAQDKQSLNNPFPNLPYILNDQTGQAICETEAIFLYIADLAQRQDLIGTSIEDRVNIARVRGTVHDIQQIYGNCAYSSEYTESYRDQIFGEKLAPKIKTLDTYLEQNQFLNEGKLCYVDFIFYEALQIIQAMDPNFLKQFTNILKFIQNFETLETIHKFINSEKYPKDHFFTGPYAKWRK